MEGYLKHSVVLALAAAGALMISGASFSDVTGSGATPGTGGTAVTPAESGHVSFDNKTATDIRERLASIINSGVTRDGFKDLVGSLEKPQRERIDGEHYTDLGSLNGTIDAFRKDFKAKYNEDFLFKSAMLDQAQIYEAGDKDHATVDLGAVFAAMDQAKAHNGLERVAEAGKSAVSNVVMGIKDLSLVKEPKLLMNGWRLQLAGAPTARQLSSALNDQIAALDSKKDTWPADVKSAYLQTARHVYKAIQDASEAPAPTASLR